MERIRKLVVIVAVLGVLYVAWRVARNTAPPRDPRQVAFASWIESSPPLRRGGNGKVDSQLLATALTTIPGEGSSWSEAPCLAVWARFEKLDPTWTWNLASHPVSLSVTTRGGTTLRCLDDELDGDRRARRIMGEEAVDDLVEVGTGFVVVSLFETPAAGTKELIVRTHLAGDASPTIELVACLVPTDGITRPDFAR